MKIKTELSTVWFQTIAYAVTAFFAIFCLIPFWLIVSGSFTSEHEIMSEGFKIWPKDISFEAFRVVFSSPDQIVSAYSVTIGLTVIGTVVGLFITSMAGYVLARPDFTYRNPIAFFIYFTTLFSGGLIPWYILIVKYLDLKDNYLAILVPLLLSAWNIILMKNFMKSIPESIIESSRIDGAGDFKIYAQIIVPLSTPGLATIGLFLALNYWNDWFHANIFMTTESKFPLQYLLYKILASAAVLKTGAANNFSANITPPTETLKMAVAVIATGPIIFLYPFVQKYFVQGLTVGAVKG
ncbi:carbohydrate ABC transporter permease [Paenibacillus sp. GCM10027628]|uniref:carbohydrate ABC transporter permease n=1 Tax=Paenibacillus sp. GCM10027628 TaxID=3273413 RepID=UPI00362CB5FF